MEKMAWIHLTKKEIEIHPIPEEDLSLFLGGRGLGAKILYEGVEAGVEPLSKENLLIFSTGPLTGTPWPTGARYTVTALSPLTGIYGYANASGYFGPKFHQAGYMVLVFSGAAKEPVYLLLTDEGLSLRPARDLWGMSTGEVEKSLKERHPGSHIASIGPAGEREVLLSLILNDGGRTAARCGLGAVMGSKRLKAIVVKTKRRVETPKAFRKKAVEMSKKLSSHPGSLALKRWGTPLLIDPKNQSGDLPARNHQDVQFEGGERVNALAFEEFKVKSKGCFACPIRCSRISEVEGEESVEGPEYETIDALGPMVGSDDPKVIIKANRICNELGIDTISVGGVIALAMESSQRGLLQDKDFSLEWGDEESILGLCRQIGLKEGLGALLGDGVKRAAERIHPSASKYALEVKGLEIPRQDPRICKAMGLGHATSNRGADHLYGLPTIDLTGNMEVAEKYFPDCLPEILQVTSQRYKPHMLVFTQEYAAISDALGICKFSTLENFALLPEDILQGLLALGFSNMDEKDLLQAGERIINLERLFNLRLGLSRREDTLPERFLKEPARVVRLEGERLTKEVLEEGLLVELEEMLDIYYELRGWDAEGLPTREKLKELGLERYVEER